VVVVSSVHLKQNGKSWTEFYFQKFFTKKFIGTDKISEIVNDSDLDDGSFSELSNSETYEANSPFSSSSSKEAEEEIVQRKPDRGRKRTCRAIPKCANTDLELGWIEKIRKFQKPAFSGVPGINKKLPNNSRQLSLGHI
jgi:hypothetical protein